MVLHGLFLAPAVNGYKFCKYSCSLVDRAVCFVLVLANTMLAAKKIEHY